MRVYRHLLLSCFLLVGSAGHGQVIISLLFGKYLNTGKVEFGLDGGLNYANLVATSESSDFSRRLNLGFYFDIKLKNPDWMIHTGVIVKSSMGGEGIAVYPTGDNGLDSVFAGGSVERRINYFNVPIGVKYITSPGIYFEGGIMSGLRYKAIDRYKTNVLSDPLEYEKDIKFDLTTFDFGTFAGIGYRLMKGHGINFTFRYYRGFVDITKHDDLQIYNQSFYFSVGIPVGVGKSKKASANPD